MKPSLIIAGLGNPGANYARTRHNAGFQALDVLSQSFGQADWKEEGRFHAGTQQARVVTFPVLLVKPLLFMNRSGEVLRKIVDFYKLDLAHQLLVISDDVDVGLGNYRFREKGGPGTHNGLKSVVEQFGEGFARIRIGLGTAPAGSDLSNWVLSVPTAAEDIELAKVFAQLPEVIRAYVLDGEGQPGHAD